MTSLLPRSQYQHPADILWCDKKYCDRRERGTPIVAAPCITLVQLRSCMHSSHYSPKSSAHSLLAFTLH